MHSLQIPSSSKDWRVSPVDFAPFDFAGTMTTAVAFDEHHNWLWCNEEAARSVASMDNNGMPPPRPEALRGMNSRKLFGEAYMEERMALLQPVLESGMPTTYFEFTWGHRVRTRVWDLKPESFGKRGWFAVVQPEMLETPITELPVPLIVTSQMGDLADLTPRELVVLRLVARGLSAKEVAKHEFRSIKTIENQISGLHVKLNIGNRAELVRFACERGLIAFSDDEWSKIVSHARARHELTSNISTDGPVIGRVTLATPPIEQGPIDRGPIKIDDAGANASEKSGGE